MKTEIHPTAAAIIATVDEGHTCCGDLDSVYEAMRQTVIELDDVALHADQYLTNEGRDQLATIFGYIAVELDVGTDGTP